MDIETVAFAISLDIRIIIKE